MPIGTPGRQTSHDVRKPYPGQTPPWSSTPHLSNHRKYPG